MRNRSLRTCGSPKTSSGWMSPTPIETGRAMPTVPGTLSSANDNARPRQSTAGGHLRPREGDKPAHLDPRSLRIDGHLAGNPVAGLRVICGANVFLDLLSPAATMLVMPEIQITPAPNRLHAITTANHHGDHVRPNVSVIVI